MTGTAKRRRLRQRLQDAGLRSTRHRLTILDLLAQEEGHLSAGDVFARLRSAGHRVTRATVYNVLADLTAAGLIEPAHMGPGTVRYEATNQRHHHFICRGCDRIIDIPCSRCDRSPCLEIPPGLVASVDEVQVVFRGLCKACGAEVSTQAPGVRSGGGQE